MNDFSNDFGLNMTPGPDAQHLVPQSSAAKQPKKRKSWGQALPEPKTSLPPRKRAKTDDEKEQRRIERIKRNRAAAHNSRERKRVEAERLEVENIHLKHQLLSMQQHVLRQHAQLTEFQRLVPNALPQLSSEEFASINFDVSDIKEERFVAPFPLPLFVTPFLPSFYLLLFVQSFFPSPFLSLSLSLSPAQTHADMLISTAAATVATLAPRLLPSTRRSIPSTRAPHSPKLPLTKTYRHPSSKQSPQLH